MRHAYGNANSVTFGHGYVYAHPDSPGYGYTYSSRYCNTDSQPVVHAVADNNTFRLE
jgi:hypothetical protein